MVKPVHIFIDRKELHGFTNMKLTRSKNDMTGQLEVGVFMGWLPESPIMVEATQGREILVYIGGALAFTGILDRRIDSANKGSQPRDAQGRFTSRASTEGGSMRTSIGPNEYTVTFTARGKTKYLIDSSQQHPTGTILRESNKTMFEILVAPWNVELVWEAAVTELDKLRLRDGGHVSDELSKLADMSSLYIFETRDGRLRVTDGATTERGEPIVLGTNIVQFSTDQTEDTTKTEIRVKGQRIDKETWGNPAVIPTLQNVANTVVDAFIPLTVQHYGNATEDLLTKRAQYEANKRSSLSKRVTVEMFNILQTDSTPWDLGILHYVEIPPANVFDLMEVQELTYTVDGDNQLSTSLTLSPAPVKLAPPGGQPEFLGDVPDVDDIVSIATNRKSLYGVVGGALNWAAPALSIIADPISAAVAAVTEATREFMGDVTPQAARPPLKLPASFESEPPND